MTEDAPRPRRPRYKGTHPRRFAEKYKEHDPARFGTEGLKVAGRGHTPAGTHRPIMVAEILERLAPCPGQRFLDATLGYGGHAQAALERLGPEGHLVGLDVDPLELPRTEARLREAGFGPERFTARRMNFAGLPALASELGPFDGILADLGLSSMQIDNPSRGFTFKEDGPLDLRMNPQRGRPAADLLAELSAEALAELFRENADEPQAEALARDLAALPQRPRTTRALADQLRATLADLGYERQDPEVRRTLQRCFQALRIAVNDEFGVLDQFLASLPRALASGGRVAILTFHSGEDRRVKKAFLEGHRAGLYTAIADSPERPSPQERHDNPRSAPAKLRWAVRS
ncbi:MAG: Ribosomal RNA small subunit methyltransferase H [Acidobacteria bacterium ADurb.Bin340]|nr:MAG: Ribosomal RNA small subunit methyltransferase H [Acidobacteria bacterium ADurb.Bin340]